MIDPATVAIGAVASSAIGAGFNIYQIKKNEEMKKALKRQRAELYVVEGCGIAALLASFIDSVMWKRRFAQLREDSSSKLDQIEIEVNELAKRVQSLNISAIDAKLDMVVAATATPKIIPETTTKAETGKKDET